MPTQSVSKTVLGVRIEAHPVVFPAAALLIVAFVALAAVLPGRSMMAFNALQSSIAEHFAWLYILAMTGFLVFALYLCCSRFGNIKLGRDDEKPEFSTMTWFAMLFSAGMGIGMLFFGVAEPMMHFNGPPSGNAHTLAAANNAMGITLFHWCLHPWALYALVGLALAYFGFRRGLPLSFRSVFYPLLGDRIHGWMGHLIDILAVLATLFGLATSLGIGAKQVNAGLHHVFGLPQSTEIQVIIIACITTMAVASLVSGLNVGIRRLSELNMCIAAGLLVFLFVFGPTRFLLSALVENTGAYIQKLPTHSFWTGAYENESDAQWLGWWTVFYWGWWIAWSPFVGMFIARVSRGRTIRQFIIGVLLVPSAVAIVWMTGFGNAALHQEIYPLVNNDAEAVQQTFDYAPRTYSVQVTDKTHGLPMTEDGAWLVAPTVKRASHPIQALVRDEGGKLVTKSGEAVKYKRGVLIDQAGTPFVPDESDRLSTPYRAVDAQLTLGGYLSQPVLNETRTARRDTTATAMFVMFEAYPLHTLTALLGTLSVILFFVTSSDSASMVADIIASGGNQNPPVGTRLFWGILEGVLAAALLYAGGLVALQTGSITIGLPFCIIIIVMCFSLMRGLRREEQGLIPEEHQAHAAGK